MNTTTLDEIKTQIASINSFLAQKVEQAVQPLKEEQDRVAKVILNTQKAFRDARRGALLASAGQSGTPRVPGGKYESFSRLDLAIVRSLLEKQPADTPGRASMLEQWRANLAAAMDSTTSGTGDELVDTQEAEQLWNDVNLDSLILGLFTRINMPTNPFDIPLQLGDVDWYPGTENVATKSTALATNKKTLTAYELVAEVPWSYDLDEDAVIAMMETLRSSLRRNSSEGLDDVFINADTTTTDNINADGATISATDAGKAQWLVGFDGLRHLPLVDATGQGNSLGAGVSLDMFNSNRRLMKRYGVRPSECVHIMDVATYLKAQTLSSFQTLDKFGPQATLLTGQLGAVEGIPVVVSEKMLLTAADGKVTDGTAGTVGGLLTVNRTQWFVGFKREMTFETVRDPQKRQNIVVVSFRVAFQQREPTIANAIHTALQYNITGVT